MRTDHKTADELGYHVDHIDRIDRYEERRREDDSAPWLVLCAVLAIVFVVGWALRSCEGPDAKTAAEFSGHFMNEGGEKP